MTVYKHGFHGDCSATVAVGTDVDTLGKNLLEIAKKALFVGINEVKPGNLFRSIGEKIE